MHFVIYFFVNHSAVFWSNFSDLQAFNLKIDYIKFHYFSFHLKNTSTAQSKSFLLNKVLMHHPAL